MIFIVALIVLRFESRVRFIRLHKELGTSEKGRSSSVFTGVRELLWGYRKKLHRYTPFIFTSPQGVTLSSPAHIPLSSRSHLAIFFKSKDDNLL
jgi:hypothetical protein